MTDYLTALAGPPPTGEAARASMHASREMTGHPVDVVTKSRGWVRNAYLNHLREAARDGQPL